ncbi:MAG TPA: cupin domain-containing protein [Clostridiaceae bacterium]|nr:cupin domain-containing protein [Clostridiaceae bacterium]
MYPIINENAVKEKNVPGRTLRWAVHKEDGLNANHCTMCIMHVEPGETVQPAHSHEDSEEVLYIIKGEGKVYIDGVIYPFKSGDIVLFEVGKIHMVRNTGKEVLKVACFFAPYTDLDTYTYFTEIDFDSGEEFVNE